MSELIKSVFQSAVDKITWSEEQRTSGDIFEFEPVPLDIFIRDKAYLGLPKLSPRQFAAVDIATQIYFPNTLRELKWRRKRYINEVVLCWGKGCPVNSLLCDTYTGELKTIKELIEERRGLQIKSLKDPKYGKPSIIDRKTSVPWKVGKDKVYRVILADGSELKVNKTHRFFKHRHSGGWRVKGDWVELKDLKVGDKIATSIYEYETWREGDKKLWWVLGLLIGDGILSGGGKDVSKASCCFVIDKDKKDLKIRLEKALAFFKCCLHYRGTSGWSEKAEIYSICGEVYTAHNNFIRQELSRLNLLGKNSYTKFVPKEIYTYTKECRVEFLRGLLETDGWVSSYDVFNRRITEIGYSSASKELIFGVKRLLASLGVRCRIRLKKVKSKHGIHYTLKVRDKFNGMKLLKYLGWEDRAEWSSKRGQRETNNDVVFEKIVSIKYVGEEDVYDLEVEGTHNYVDADGFLNHNSGKDYISRIIHLRIVYLLSALKNPQAYFYHPDHPVGIEPFHLLNTATTKNQAATIFFTPLRGLIKHSPFFKVRSDVLTTTVRFEKGIQLISGHSEAEAHEGMNLICAILDEIAAFKTDEEVEDIRRLRLRKNIPQSASSIYDFVHSSRVTRFPLVGKVVLLSFPRFKGDYIMTKYDEGKDRKSVYVDKGTTFEINPTKKESDFQEEAEMNPTRYKCRILCQPSIAEDAFFKNEKALKRAFSQEIPHPVDKETNRLKHWFYCDDKFSRYMHVDLAKNRDRAAVAMCHAYEAHEHEMKVRNSKGEEEEKIVQLPMIRLDLLAYFVALPGREIDYDIIQDMILDVHENRGFRISLCTFDGYQSVQMMQTLENRGIPTDNLSVDRTREPYESFQDVLYDGRLISFFDEILVEEEIPFLIDYKGKKIEHRKGRSKDGSDAVAGAIHNCVVDEGWGGYEIGIGERHDDELKSFLKDANRRLGDASY